MIRVIYSRFTIPWARRNKKTKRRIPTSNTFFTTIFIIRCWN